MSQNVGASGPPGQRKGGPFPNATISTTRLFEKREGAVPLGVLNLGRSIGMSRREGGKNESSSALSEPID